ncbi:MAG: Isochorismatase family, partial [Bacteroidetes bacterium]|nr:Isochorismatase family [Bacteroidota bacterium]
DGFNKTDLNKVLQEKGVNTVFMCGLSAVGCVLATWIGAQNNDYKAFMIKDALLSHDADYTNTIEAMFDAVGPDVITLVLENAGK